MESPRTRPAMAAFDTAAGSARSGTGPRSTRSCVGRAAGPRWRGPAARPTQLRVLRGPVPDLAEPAAVSKAAIAGRVLGDSIELHVLADHDSSHRHLHLLSV